MQLPNFSAEVYEKDRHELYSDWPGIREAQRKALKIPIFRMGIHSGRISKVKPHLPAAARRLGTTYPWTFAAHLACCRILLSGPYGKDDRGIQREMEGRTAVFLCAPRKSAYVLPSVNLPCPISLFTRMTMVFCPSLKRPAGTTSFVAERLERNARQSAAWHSRLDEMDLGLREDWAQEKMPEDAPDSVAERASECAADEETAEGSAWQDVEIPFFAFLPQKHHRNTCLSASENHHIPPAYLCPSRIQSWNRRDLH